ncbi:MAG: Hsp20/alpha crystallin family protein [Gemmatimonadota bacterium]|nr:Hsp20/alpha crystallin family protein [Gemmatimonadota bacterium]
MAIVKTTRTPVRAPNPWSELDWFANRVGRMFGDTDFGNLSYGSAWVPSVNVEERDDEIVLTAELPGLAEEDIHLELENNVLTVAGEKRAEREEGEAGSRYHLVERSFGSFRRSFTLPRTVDSEGITADFDGGLLKVRMPKAAEAKSRRITVGKKA